MCPAVFVVSRVPVAGLQITGEDTGRIKCGGMSCGPGAVQDRTSTATTAFDLSDREARRTRHGSNNLPILPQSALSTGKHRENIILCFFSAGREAAEQTNLYFPADIGGKRKAFSIRRYDIAAGLDVVNAKRFPSSFYRKPASVAGVDFARLVLVCNSQCRACRAFVGALRRAPSPLPGVPAVGRCCLRQRRLPKKFSATGRNVNGIGGIALVRDKLDLVQDALEEALDEVTTLKVEVDGMVLRSAKQPPAKKRYDHDHYRTAGAKLTRDEYARLRALAFRRGKTVSRLLRDHIDALLRS